MTAHDQETKTADELPKLYSIQDVFALFPESHKPSLRRLKAKARSTGCCRVIGKTIAFTHDDVRKFLECLTPFPRAEQVAVRKIPAPGERRIKKAAKSRLRAL